MTTDEKIADVLATGRARVKRKARGAWVDPTIVVERGCSEWTFYLGRDDVWRLTYVSTYGNLSGAVCGNDGSILARPCCDASGHRVNTPNAINLNHVLRAAK